MSKIVFISLAVNLKEEHSNPTFQENLLKDINIKFGLNAEEFMLGERFSVFFLSVDDNTEITDKIETLRKIFKSLKYEGEIYLKEIYEDDYDTAKNKIHMYQ